MAFRDWIDVETLRAGTHHASGCLGTLVFYLILFSIVKYFMHDGILKTILELIEGGVLVGVMLILAYKVLKLLTKGGGPDGHLHALVA